MKFKQIKIRQIKLKAKQLASLAVLIALWLLPVSAPQAVEIKKCQDENGEWHYGDYADEACAKSIVNILNESGVKVGENHPPLTEEQIRELDELAKTQVDVEERRKRDIDVLRIYGSEETIISIRDRELADNRERIAFTRKIKQGTLNDIAEWTEKTQTVKIKKTLEDWEAAVISYNRVIRHNLTERDRISEKYIGLLNEYREAYIRIYGE